MAEEIRGLNIKFDADFSDFKKSMKSAEKDIGSTQRQLKTLQDSLKLEWDPKKFSQAQAQAQQALDATEKKASILRERLQQMETAGVTDKTRDQYNWLTEEINKTELSAKRLEDQLKSLDSIRLANLTAGIDKTSKVLATAATKTRGLSLAAGAAVAGMTTLGLQTVATADDVATLATTYNMSTDAIQRFNYVALQTDTASEALYKGFVKAQAGVADLSVGVSTVATKALQELGLSFDRIQGSENQFYAIIDALATLEDQTKMVSLANDIFGERMATSLFPLIYAGTDAIDMYKREFEDMGALTEEQVQKLAEFDNVLNRLKTQAVNTGLGVGESLLPVIETFSEVISEDVLPVIREFSEWFRELDDGQKKAAVSMLMLTATLSPMLRIASNTASGISTLVKWLDKMDKATLSSYGKWALLAASIGSVFSVITNWEKMGTAQRVIGLLGSLSAAALAAALAFGAFHSAWSVGIAAAGIVAGIAAATAAVRSAADEIGTRPAVQSYSPSSGDFSSYTVPSYSPSSTSTSYSDTYVDNSVVNVTIEKNEYVSEDEIIQSVNKALKQARQVRK